MQKGKKLHECSLAVKHARTHILAFCRQLKWQQRETFVNDICFFVCFVDDGKQTGAQIKYFDQKALFLH